MGKFNHDKRPGGDYKSHGSDQGRGGFGRPGMHQAVCSECGRRCEVPFKPTGEKPVYCNDCFRLKKSASFGQPAKESYNRPSYGDKKPTGNDPALRDQLAQLNVKLDKILKMLSPEVSVEPAAAKSETAKVEKNGKAKKTDKKKSPAKNDKAKKKK
jgi:CxxC-x17-CxxC domain-containing protein